MHPNMNSIMMLPKDGYGKLFLNDDGTGISSVNQRLIDLFERILYN